MEGWNIGTSPRRLFHYSIIPLFLFLSFFSFASDDCIPEKPSPERLVNNLSKDAPDFISEQEEQALEQKLENFSNETSNRIAIVIVDDLCGLDVNEFGTNLFNKWKIGGSKNNNGVLILIKPTGKEGQRKAYIVTGYGLEGIIPDITAKHIVSNEIIPRFKNKDFYGGLDAATDVLMSLAKKEFNYSDYEDQSNDNWLSILIPVIIIFLLFFFVIRNSRGYTSIGGRRTYYGGGWGGGFGGGGFGGGSSGGGGFGGFGGGSSGGGGAGGSW